MDVILLEKISKLGNLGDVVKVKNGFGRNFLIPHGKALPSTDSNRSRFEAEREEHEKRQTDVRAKAEHLAKKVAELEVLISRPAGNSEKLFGSVTNSDIAEFFKANGVVIPRRVIELISPIRTLGEHEVRLVLHSDVAPVINVTVERSAKT